jgi:prepilin-type processing-associated H-X9-DG protein
MRTLKKSDTAFTIVELLVVIAIIAALTALLLPAVQAARESGRRTNCMANQTQVCLALNGFDQSQGYIPGWRNKNPSGAGVTPSWPIPILPQLERNDVYQAWVAGQTPSGYFNVFVCSSSALPSTANAILSYAGNAGSLSNDRKWDGVLLDTNVTSTGRITFSDISDGDGTGNTILISEKSAAAVTPQLWGVIPQVRSGYATDAIAFGSLPVIGITQVPAESSTSNMPSSNHGSGCVVGFCDGHVMFMRNDIASHVYAQLITSKNSRASEYARNSPAASPPGWGTASYLLLDTDYK